MVVEKEARGCLFPCGPKGLPDPDLIVSLGHWNFLRVGGLPVNRKWNFRTSYLFQLPSTWHLGRINPQKTFKPVLTSGFTDLVTVHAVFRLVLGSLFPLVYFAYILRISVYLLGPLGMTPLLHSRCSFPL